MPELQDQPAYVIRMRAKPGCGDKLFELATIGDGEVELFRPLHHGA